MGEQANERICLYRKQRTGLEMWSKNQEAVVVIKAKGRERFNTEAEVKNYVK